ncbi:hypothetical protein EIP91_007269 [Steccherinum ochraceum]|uniref:WSC domain-containing protein n=1 Tax=Steccherinum ochraceum TaxID=92696 RepID=A0A4R0R712_9APHY|nr:hypothetical protein EIP91_007269 [Steccherinum ochraceum]
MRFSQSLRANLVLSALVALPLVNAVHVIFGGTRSVVTTRLDPIVNPGTVGSHMHNIAGGNGFKDTYSYDALTSDSTCTTVVIPQDKSNYWTPSIYHHNTNGTFTLMPAGFNIYYLVRGATGDKIVAPPPGLVMVAGDPNRRTYNASSHADQAVSFVCLDYSGAHNGDPDWAERPDFFDHTCPDGLRAQVFFPACWDGKNLDSPDHKSHMSYPIDAYNNGECPSTHPVHIISIFYEMFVSVDQYDYHGPGTWVLANGDTTGLGFHGDFAMGWTDPGLITSLINDCPNAAGNVADCPALAAVMDTNAAAACRFNGQLVDEPVGDTAPITALPGCNPVWEGTGAKPTCPNAPPAPGLTDAQEALLPGWTNVGCIVEGTTSRALTGATYTDAVGMTLNTCAAFCANKGFTYAGIEWSQECYCGNTLTGGASTNTVSGDQCSNACAGNQYQTCGGPQRLTLLHNPTPGKTPPPSSAPASSAPATSAPASSTPVSSAPTTSAASSVSSPVKVVTTTSPSKPTTTLIVPPSSSAGSTTVVSSVTSANPTSAKPTTTVVTSSPPSASSPSSPGSWVADGCVQDSASRVLQGASTSSNKMTIPTCQAFCDSKGFTYAGLEYGQECYCGNALAKRVDINQAQQCYMTCSDGQKCGGTWAISLFKKGASTVPPTTTTVSTPPASSAPATPSGSIPAGWTAAGCAHDGNNRALDGYMFTSDSMTAGICTSTCASKGFARAGVEYGRECWCGNEFENGEGYTLADNYCNVRTADGGPGGGAWAMSVFQNAAALTKTKRSLTKVKRSAMAKHFGRNAHAHAAL